MYAFFLRPLSVPDYLYVEDGMIPLLPKKVLQPADLALEHPEA
jgi:hypothetical protein